MALTPVSDPDELKSGFADAALLELSCERRRLRQSLYEFLKWSWQFIEPEHTFVENWHLIEMCRVLQDIGTGKDVRPRHIFNIPPGTLKSILVSVVFPAWVWARNPTKKFLTAAYGAHLTTRDNLRVRDIIQSKEFQLMFPIKLVEDQNTKTRFNTNKGGWRIATSISGVGTGEHPDFIIIDDPTTAQQALSAPERQSANDWFDKTMSTRGMAYHVVVIVVMQRLHQEDLTGHLLARGGVNLIRLPMRYEKCTCPPLEDGQTVVPDDLRCVPHKADPDWNPYPGDPRTEPGELLFPQLFNEEKVKRIELDLGSDAAGQLQQRPSPEGGGLFQRGWFKFLDAMPAHIQRETRGWDTAGTPGAGDYTVGVKIAEFDVGKFIVADVVRDQWGPGDVDKNIRATAFLDGKSCPVREEKEGGSSGKAVIEARALLLVGFDYRGVQISGNKATRAKPFRAQCEAGNVYLLRAPWNAEYVRELCNFPNGKNDDQLDGSSCSFNSVLLEPKRKQHDITW